MTANRILTDNSEQSTPTAARQSLRRNGNANKLEPGDRPAHDWYRFVLSFPPHLVREYLNRFQAGPDSLVLDPFCGTGTTIIESKKQGVPSVGIESNPMAYFAARVKTAWDIDPTGLVGHAQLVADAAMEVLGQAELSEAPVLALEEQYDRYGLRRLPSEARELLLTGSISPLPLHRVLVLLEQLSHHHDTRFADHEKLALARAIVTDIGNLHFGPEVGVGEAKKDAPAVSAWCCRVRAMADDLPVLQSLPYTPALVHHADARDMSAVVPPASISAVITSPPYPNEKDYTRTTRLESVLLGFLKTKADLQALKAGLIRSNTRTVYKADDDDKWVDDDPEVQRIAQAIEARRVELGKTSGFERLYHRVTKLYFGGMKRHLAELRPLLRPGARLAYVVGDQASYLRVMIRTGQILADIARSLGYEVMGLDLFRTRLATATRENLREEVLLLRWPCA